ncbi:MAG TPA: MBL fold metallo-hydrolase [Candidatus Dormibacteraeota bacterium]|nr:MBL fold metallo-hydrolase [Candidatus Dormibacteraeota bacterium]
MIASSGTVLTFLATGNPTGLSFSVEHGGTRAIFDLGREYSPGGAPFSQGLVPRPGRELSDLIEMGMAPRLEGVYEAWDGRTSIFLSHLHLDHTGLVGFIHPDLPLHYPAGMEDLRLACVEAGEVPWRDPAGLSVEEGATIDVGGIAVTFLPVDHDLPGACGFLIRTPDATIAFTGDHRWHGLHPERTAAFAEAVRGADLLLQEGVRLGLPPSPEDALDDTEAGLHRRFAELLEETPGLVVVNLYPMNRERVAAFGRACAAAGRRFLMEPAAARVAGWPDVLEDEDEVRRSPERHCLQLGFTSLPRLIDLRPPAGSRYVHADGGPLGRFDPAYPVMRTWADLLGLEFVPLRCSGHSRPEDIVRMVEEVRPRLVLPVHTRAPEALEVPGVRSLCPQPLRPYPMAELLDA